jgi:hypothetical protein
LKLFSSITKETLDAEESKDEVVELAKFLESKMSELVLSSDLEVQERASSVLEVVKETCMFWSWDGLIVNSSVSCLGGEIHHQTAGWRL